MVTGGGMASGALDPETLYTKQSCIGPHTPPTCFISSNTDDSQVAAVLARFTKGERETFLIPNHTRIAPLTVHSVDKRTGQAVAIKVIDVENAEDEVEDIIQEISILSELHSPYVTQYHGSYLKGSDLWIVMEFCSGGSCGDLMKPGLIQEEYISIIIRELLLGLDYLHSDKKLHRDIKGKRLFKCTERYTLLTCYFCSCQRLTWFQRPG